MVRGRQSRHPRRQGDRSLKPLTLASLGWIAPAIVALLLGTVAWLDGAVAYPEYEEEPPCYGTEDGETVCPEPEVQSPSPLRSAISMLSAERVTVPVAALGLLAGLAFSGTTLVRTWKSRKVEPKDRLAFRLSLASMLALVAVPLIGGLLLLLVLMSFQIRG